MNFLKNLFGGSNHRGSGDGRTFYVYVRPKRCDQLVEVRIDLFNDLSMDDTGNQFFIRKTAQAIRCPFAAEMTLYFDKNRKFINGEIENGDFVTSDDYAAWVAEQKTE